MKHYKIIVFTAFFVLAKMSLLAQNGDSISERKSKFPYLKPVAIAEIWGTYSYGEKQGNEGYADQYDLHFRRLRFGAVGKANSWLNYHFQFHADRLGENNYASTKSKYQGIGLWCAQVTAQISKNSDLAYFHAGYYNIAVSRESYSSFKVLGTLDKVQPDWYLRHFLTGKGNGIESGFGLGGFKDFKKVRLSYRTSLFMPQLYLGSKNNSLLYSCRITTSAGDQSGYKYMIANKNWKKQKMIELGFGTAYQADGYLNDTLSFSKTGSLGTDLLLHYQGFIIDGAYYRLFREANSLPGFSAYLWHVRGSYNFEFFGEHLEFCLSYQNYQGDGNKALYKYVGDDTTFDAGFNWYVNNEKVKLALHYINQAGKASTNTGDYFACSLLMILQ